KALRAAIVGSLLRKLRSLERCRCRCEGEPVTPLGECVRSTRYAICLLLAIGEQHVAELPAKRARLNSPRGVTGSPTAIPSCQTTGAFGMAPLRPGESPLLWPSYSD